MKHLLALFLLCFCMTISGRAQVVDATVCAILANPQSFDGKIVRVKGTVEAGFDEFVLKDAACDQPVAAIWLVYPEGTKGKAGPAVSVTFQLAKNNSATTPNRSRSPIKLDKNKDFKQFDSLLATPYKAGGMCLGCTRYLVTATLVGRLDGDQVAGIIRDAAGKFIGVGGYGNLNVYRARLVLQAVSDVSSQEIDYSRVSPQTKDDSVKESAGNPVAAAGQAARAFPSDSQAAKQLQQAAAAYGNAGDDNGVEIGFGPGNEVSRNDQAKGDKNSPDGLLINCTFDADRLKGDALPRAMTHVGTHIADLRGPQSSTPTSAYQLEYRAWQTTALSALAFQQKTLTMPGGYLLWNSTWPAADRSKMLDEAIAAYLKDWAALGK